MVSFCASYFFPEGNSRWFEKARGGLAQVWVLSLVGEFGRLLGRVLCLGRLLRNSLLWEGEKSIFTSTAQCVPLQGTALIYEHSCATEVGGVRHVRTTELTFPFHLKYCLVLYLDCFLSETKE